MHHNSSKKKEIIRLSIVYTAMVVSVLLIVSLISLFMLGYRFTNDGDIEQYGLLQFSSRPSGSNVSVDGDVVGTNTPTKKIVKAGSHDVVMWRDGYKSWSKTVNVKSGTVVWLNYALMVPNKLAAEKVLDFTAIANSITSPKNNYIMVQPNSNLTTLNLIDIGSDTIKNLKLEVPNAIISQYLNASIVHSYQIEKWDDSERYLLIKHLFGDSFEWLVLDTQDVSASRNISTTLALEISDIDFFGSNGRTFYALINKELKKIDLSNNSVSKAVASGVKNFKVYNKSNVVSFVASNPADSAQSIAAIFRDGDSRFYTLRESIVSDLKIAAAHYFNVDYVAISDGQSVEILRGNFPSVDRDSSTSLKTLTNLSITNGVKQLSFSPSGQYVFMQSSNNFASYNLEYEMLSNSTIALATANVSMDWINDNYIWSSVNGKLTIREFDGQNIHELNSISDSQDVALSRNGRYIYSFDKADSGFILQRVRMILP